MEAEKLKDLSASWQAREAEVYFSLHLKFENQGSWSVKSQPQSESPRTSRADVRGREKTDISAEAESKFTLPRHFCSI